MSDRGPRPGGHHLVLLGLMAAGKTTTAVALAERLGWPMSDSDDEIKGLTGVNGSGVAAEFGVPVLHRIEQSVLLAALARPDPHIITAAASVVDDDLVLELLGAPTVVRLAVDPAVAHQRQRPADHRRPIPLAELIRLATLREPRFCAVENLRVDGTLPVEQIVAEIIDFVGRRSHSDGPAPTPGHDGLEPGRLHDPKIQR